MLRTVVSSLMVVQQWPLRRRSGSVGEPVTNRSSDVAYRVSPPTLATVFGIALARMRASRATAPLPCYGNFLTDQSARRLPVRMLKSFCRRRMWAPTPWMLRLHRKLPATTDSLKQLRSLAVAFALENCEPDDQLLGDLALAVSEAATNVVQHAYHNHPEPGPM